MLSNKKISVVFMGTPLFAANVLLKLISDENIEVVGCYTNPDAIRSRGKKLVPSPVKEVCLSNNIECNTPKNFKDKDVVGKLKSYNADFICVAAYSVLLSKEVLKACKYCCLNVHGSILPRWRGAAPFQRAILNGDENIGVSIMKMEEGLDTGDFCKSVSVKNNEQSLSEIVDQLSILGAKALVESMQDIVNDKCEWVKQDEKYVTYAKKLSKRELYLDPSFTAKQAIRAICASDNTHPCKCCINGKNVTIISATLSKDSIAKNGRIIAADKKMYLGFKDGSIQVIAIKPDGKQTMDAFSFACGIQNAKSGNVGWNIIK